MCPWSLDRIAIRTIRQNYRKAMDKHNKEELNITSEIVTSYLRLACENFEQEGDCEILLYALNNAMRAVCKLEAANVSLTCFSGRDAC